MQEIWKDISGYVGYYKVSNFGRVKSVKRVTRSGRTVNERVLSASGNPYLQVALSKDGYICNVRVHRLVAHAFIPNPNNLPCVNHKDENKLNNHADNLEWCTVSYNNDYSGVGLKATLSKLGKPLSFEHRQKISETLKKTGSERSKKRMQTMKEKYPDRYKLTEEQKSKISASMKGKLKTEETKNKMRKPKSEEHIEHMREAQKLSHEARKLGMTYKEYKNYLSEIGNMQS